MQDCEYWQNVVAHTCKSRIQEAELGELSLPNQLDLQNKTISQLQIVKFGTENKRR